jgi:hypothetical protein
MIETLRMTLAPSPSADNRRPREKPRWLLDLVKT